jgi:hypothetical protein
VSPRLCQKLLESQISDITQLLFRSASKRIKTFEDNFPKFKEEVLAALSSDADSFERLLTYTDGAEGKYQHIPILKEIPAEQFVHAWLMCPNGWDKLSTVMEQRYNAGAFADEQQWRQEMYAHMIETISKLPVLKQRQLRWSVPVEFKVNA